MDVLRSCYTGKMRFKASDNPVSVAWFFADKQAKIFRAPTLFRSADFESTPFQNNGLGEQRPPRGSWRNGMRPSLLDGLKADQHFPLAFWEEGIPADVTTSLPRLPTWEPILCISPAVGVRFNGAAVVKKGKWPGFGGGVGFGGSAVVNSGFASPGGMLFGGAAVHHP
jgi:hypothetical protein